MKIAANIAGARALVTGGAGFVGSHLCEALLAAGCEVVALDNLSTGTRANVAHLDPRSGFELVVGDIADEELVASLVARSDVIFHLAAAVGVEMIVDSPLRSLHANVAGTEVVLRVAARYGVPVLPGLHLRGVRQGRVLPAGRGGQHHPRPQQRSPLVLCRRQVARRVPGFGLPPGVRPSRCHLPSFQHRRPAPDRPLRHGHPALRRGGALGRHARGQRRRPAVALLPPRARRGRRDHAARRHAHGRRQRVQRRLVRRGLDPRARRARPGEGARAPRAGRAGARAPRPDPHALLRRGLPERRLRGHPPPRAGHRAPDGAHGLAAAALARRRRSRPCWASGWARRSRPPAGSHWCDRGGRAAAAGSRPGPRVRRSGRRGADALRARQRHHAGSGS